MDVSSILTVASNLKCLLVYCSQVGMDKLCEVAALSPEQSAESVLSSSAQREHVKAFGHSRKGSRSSAVCLPTLADGRLRDNGQT